MTLVQQFNINYYTTNTRDTTELSVCDEHVFIFFKVKFITSYS